MDPKHYIKQPEVTGNEQWQEESAQVGQLIAQALAEGYELNLKLCDGAELACMGPIKAKLKKNGDACTSYGDTPYEALAVALGNGPPGVRVWCKEE